MHMIHSDLPQGVAPQGRVETHEEPGGAEADGDADGDGGGEKEEGAEACFLTLCLR